MSPDALLPLDLQRFAILLDVDGTILDFAPTPREVWVPPGLQDVLLQLLKKTDGAVGLVSGRSLEDLDLIFTPLQMAGVGCHGAELRPVFGAPQERPRAAPLDEGIKRRFATIKNLAPGILLEDKGYSLAVHYRLAPDCEQAVREAIASIGAGLRDMPIEVLPGKFVLEIKSAGITKALGVRELMKCPSFADRRPIFIGDDVTDETIFPIIPEYSGYCFSVGREIEGTNGCFDSPESVRRWLTKLAQSPMPERRSA